MGRSKKVTLGYKYYLGMHMVICHGPVDAVQEIQVGGRTAWTGNVTDNTQITIAAENLFGGKKKEGGVSGKVDILMGAPTQAKNDYLMDKLGPVIPAFRGVVSAVLRKCYVTAMTPYPKPWAFKVKRIPAKSWYGAKAEINGGANGAHIIYEVLTNTDWGMGYGPDAIDEASFRAAADTLYAENLGLSFALSNTDSIEEFIEVITQHINAMFYVDPYTGKFALRLVREDYDPETLPVFDESNVVRLVSFERPSFAEMVNEIVVVYRPQGSANDDSVTVQDLAAIQAQEGIVSQTVNYPGIDNATNAARLGLRDLRQRSTPLARLRIKVNRTAWDLSLGDVFKFNWEEHGISGLIVRVLDIDPGTLENGEITIEGVEDVFGLPLTTYVNDQPSGWNDPVQPPAAAAYRLVHEATYWDTFRRISEADWAYVTSTSSYVSSIVGEPDQAAINYELWTRPGAGDFVLADDAAFAPHGTLVSDITPNQTSLVIDNLRGVFNDIVLGTYGIVDSEIVRIDALNPDTGAVTLGRGCLDTVPAAHLAGAQLFFAEDVLGIDQTEYATGETINVKILPRTGSGVLAIGSAPQDDVLLSGRMHKPYPPGNVKVNGSYFPTAILGAYSLSWAHRDRTQQVASLIDFTAGNIGPEPGTTYTLRLYGETDTLLRTETGLTGTSYAWTAEQADSGLTVLGSEGGADYDTVVAASAPTARWKMDETSGTTMLDSVGGYHGTYFNGVLLGQPPLVADAGKSAKFDGSDDYATVPDNAALRPGTGEYAIEMTVKFTGTAFGMAFGKFADPHPYPGPTVFFNSANDTTVAGRIEFRDKRQSGYWVDSVATGLNDGVARHYVFQRRQVTAGVWKLEMYINGTLDAATTLPTVEDLNTANKIYVGSRDNIQRLNCTTDDVIYYVGRALTPEEVQSHYLASVGLSAMPRLNGRIRAELESVRAGLTSHQKHNITVDRAGWGYQWGNYWGGI